MNDLIKQYSQSDDFGEYSKKLELWESIRACPEVLAFMGREGSLKILERYGVMLPKN